MQPAAPLIKEAVMTAAVSLTILVFVVVELVLEGALSAFRARS